MDIHMAESLVPEPSLVEVKIAIGKLKSYKSPGTDQIPAELFKAGGETLYSEIHRLICCIWNKEELPHHLKDFIVVPIHKKGDKTDCNNYRGISLLSSAYCGFRLNRSTIDQIFYIRQILEKKWEYNGTVH
jgi:hypothetical protein